ncbi:MAG: site-specific recombinase [Bradyrhizobium sp.]|jgi:site-specific DNA recombinase|nr:site-specific recombinase [Bradyrhizobium sp.]
MTQLSLASNQAKARKFSRDTKMRSSTPEPTLLNLILKGGAADKINTKMVQLESRKAELERVLVDAGEPPPLLHPEMATFYPEQVSALHEALQADPEATRLKAGEVLRSLVKEIVLAPEGGDLKIDVRGDLAGILAVSLKTKTPATRAGVLQFEIVAGSRNHPIRHSPMVAI